MTKEFVNFGFLQQIFRDGNCFCDNKRVEDGKLFVIFITLKWFQMKNTSTAAKWLVLRLVNAESYLDGQHSGELKHTGQLKCT